LILLAKSPDPSLAEDAALRRPKRHTPERVKRGYQPEPRDRQLPVKPHDDGSVTVRDVATGESFTPTRLFWFARFAFHRET
jgi:hypothetical protein